MKKISLFVIYICILTLIVPLLTINICINIWEKEKYINVYVKNEDKVEKMEISQYLKEVVAAEMPASFSFEALKAQAVAARTYLENRRMSGDSDEAHKGADICTDYTHCKAWLSEADRRNAWEEDKRDEYWDKISKAVDETENEIITYDGKPISAVFHSTSSGKTESAKDVWGSDIPYLQSVESEGDLYSPKYNSEFICSIDEYKNRISERVENTNPDAELFSDIIRSDAGGIISLNVMGVTINGTEFRNIFGLRSTNVQFETVENNIHMNVLGYGHGVGMSQYGADYMGTQGSTYKEILAKYYIDTKLEKK